MDGPILRQRIADETAVSRRAILQGSGLLLGFALTGASTESVFAAPASQVVENEVTGTFAPNGFIRINPTGAVTLVMPMVEMGQGVYTSLSMLLAEAARCRWKFIRSFIMKSGCRSCALAAASSSALGINHRLIGLRR